jgi:uncharacterized membrane protein YidH (DUF202 family)
MTPAARDPDHGETSSTYNLARERNREAADRTLMAWIRTSLTLIAFGFGISQFYSYIELAVPDIKLDPRSSALIFGVAFITLGTLSLMAAIVQHWRILRRIKMGEDEYRPLRPLTEVVAVLLLLIGLFTFFDAII